MLYSTNQQVSNISYWFFNWFVFVPGLKFWRTSPLNFFYSDIKTLGKSTNSAPLYICMKVLSYSLKQKSSLSKFQIHLTEDCSQEVYGSVIVLCNSLSLHSERFVIKRPKILFVF